MKNALMRFALGSSFAAMLAGCGGGEGITTGNDLFAPGARVVQEDAYRDLLNDAHEQILDNVEPGNIVDATAAAAQTMPVFGSVVQSTVYGGTSEVTDVSVETSLSVDASGSPDMEVTIETADRTIELGHVSTSLDEQHITFGSGSWETFDGGNGVRKAAKHTHFVTNRENGVTTSRVQGSTFMNWNADNPTDYFAGGYWMHFDSMGAVTSLGAFVDAPEIDDATRNRAYLPTSGTGSYTGVAEGRYAGVLKAADRDDLDSDVSHVGVFTGDVNLTARWSRNNPTISGNITNIDLSYTASAADNADVVTIGWTEPSGYSIELGQATFDSFDSANGPSEFSGGTVTVSHDTLSLVGDSSGAWGGQLSTIPSSAYIPRLALGTFGGTGETEAGSQTSFIGAFFAIGETAR